jgi:hypothetical protein
VCPANTLDTVEFTPRGLAHATKLAEKPSSRLGAIGYLAKNGTTSLRSLTARHGRLEVMAATCQECYAPYDGTCLNHAYSWRGKLMLMEICMCMESYSLPGVQSGWSELLEPVSGEICSKPMDAPRCALCEKVRTSSITALST